MSLPPPLLLLLLLLLLCSSTSSKQSLQASVQEESPLGTFVLSLPKAMDIDKDLSPAEARLVRYNFLGRESPYFRLDSRSGVLHTRARIDRETVCATRRPSQHSDECFLTVLVKLSPIKLFRVAKVQVHIEDINDNAPAFQQPRLNFRVKENRGPNTRLRLPVSDPDSQRNSLDIVLLEGRDRQHFVASLLPNRQGVELTLKPRLDREAQEKYVVKIVAKDGGVAPRTGSALVTVEVADENDCIPAWIVSNFTITVPEDRPVNAEIFRLAARDKDAGDNGRVVYNFDTKTIRDDDAAAAESLFYIDPDSGSVRVRSELDYEARSTIEIPVIARDDGKDKQNTASATITVHLEDVNDNDPKVEITPVESGERLRIRENAQPGLPVATVRASDADSGKSRQVTCAMEDAGPFRLRSMERDVPNMYTLVASRKLDREEKSVHDITIACHDYGTPQRTTTRLLTIHVVDENDNRPVFAEQVFQLHFAENNHVGQYVGTVNASDKDEGANGIIEYSLSEEGSRVVSINSATGRLYAREKFDREQKDRYQFRVFARDSPKDGAKRHTAMGTVEMVIDDQNDHSPRFPRLYVFSIPEHSSVNTFVGNVAAEDADTGPNSALTYRLLTGMREFEIHRTRGDITVRTTRLDREQQAMYEVRVRAEDAGTKMRSGDTLVRITLTDINDHAPRFIFPNTVNNVVNVSCKEHANEVIAKVHANDSDSGRNAFVVYDIVPRAGGRHHSTSATGSVTDGRYELDKTSGQLLLIKQFENCRPRRETLLIKASDMGEQPKSTHVTLVILVTDLQPRSDEGLADFGPTRANLTAIIGLIIATVLLFAILIGAVWILRRYSMQDSRDKYTEGRLEATITQNQHPAPMKMESPDGMSLRLPGSKHEFDPLSGDFGYNPADTHPPPLYDYACGDDDDTERTVPSQGPKSKLYDEAPYQSIRGVDCPDDGLQSPGAKTLPYSKLNADSIRHSDTLVKAGKLNNQRTTSVCLTEFKASPTTSHAVSGANAVTTLKNPYCTVSFV